MIPDIENIILLDPNYTKPNECIVYRLTTYGDKASPTLKEHDRFEFKGNCGMLGTHAERHGYTPDSTLVVMERQSPSAVRNVKRLGFNVVTMRGFRGMALNVYIGPPMDPSAELLLSKSLQ
jgi:hypothetical protein